MSLLSVLFKITCPMVVGVVPQSRGRLISTMGLNPACIVSSVLCFNTSGAGNTFARVCSAQQYFSTVVMSRQRSGRALLFLVLGKRSLGARARCRVCSQRGKTAPERPPCPCRARDVRAIRVWLVSRFCAPARPSLVRSLGWVCWSLGWGYIARVACLWCASISPCAR